MRSLITALLFTPLLTWAQSWAPIGAKWTYEQGSCCGPDTNLAIIHAVSDTVLLERNYTQLEASEGFFTCHPFLPLFAANNDTVWYWDVIHEEERLMFRWNAVPGDTWTTAVPLSEDVMDTLEWAVLDTGHVVIDGLFLRQLSLEVGSALGFVYSPGQGLFTERLGGHIAPFTWAYGPCDAETFNRLRCYEDPEIHWQNPTVPQCALTPPSVIRFDAPSAFWFVADTYPHGSPQSPGFIETSTTRYFSGGTQLLDGGPWRELYAQSTQADAGPPEFLGMAQQTGDVVRFRHPNGAIDTLYDFGLQVGDSMRYRITEDFDVYLTVIAVDNIEIEEVVHRVIRFDFSDEMITPESVFRDIWIEGIGSTHGPLAPFRPQDVNEWFYLDSTRTTCYGQNNTMIWHHASYTNCIKNIILGLDELEHARIDLYPNPTPDAVWIDGLPPGTWSFTVIDLLGRIGTTGTTTASGPRRIDLQALRSGVYTLRFDALPHRAFRLIKE